MFKEFVAEFVAKRVGGTKEKILSMLETPPNPEMGDFAFPCFYLSKDLKKSPEIIAQGMAREMKPTREIERIEVKGAYINFFVNKKIIAEHVININDSYGKGRQKEKILLEHTSNNPDASPHVGRTRNSIIGDSIYRILTFLGNNVERHYYVNDVSKQVAILALEFKEGDSFENLLEKYVKASKKVKENPELEKKVFNMLDKFEHKDKQIVDLFKKIVELAVQGQEKIFASMGIKWDYFDYESRYIDEGKNVLKELEATKKVSKDREGRIILNQKGTGLEVKMKAPILVLARSNGTGLYVLRDLAYTIEKCSKGRNIIVLGEDQKLYFEQLRQALLLMRKPVPEVVHYSFVLIKGGGKMSTRRGEVVLLSEFLDEAKKKADKEIKKRKTKGDAMKIAIAAVKYSMLKNDNDKNIIFDLEQSLNFEGDSGPYLQYSYARASSILKKAKKKQAKAEVPNLEGCEIKLIKKISDFPQIVELSGKNLSPSFIANYSFELAQAFNEFYANSKVIGSKEEAFRLNLVNSFKITMKSCLWLLGIDAIEEM